MTYQPYLIANYATGLSKRLQPWLIPDDAQEQIYDADVYRGVISKRDGYNYFAIGQMGGSPYRESRINSKITVEMDGALNGINTTFTLDGNPQIVRGSVTASSTTPVQSLSDNGLGLDGGFVGAGMGTVNYITGSIVVDFTLAPTATRPTVTYSFMPGNPVMMVANFVTASSRNGLNVKDLIVCDTEYVNKYNSALNILEDITVVPYTGDKYAFFTWVNYDSATNEPRLLFSNNKNPIQQYDGALVSNYAYNMNSSDVPPVPVNMLTCAFMVEMKERLLLLRTNENGTIYPKRIRISGTGANCDNFDLTAIGAGFIDIPDGTWIQGCTFNRDDLIIFTERSTWVLKYTGNDASPFVLNKIDETRGCEAGFSAFTYLNRSSAASRRGLIISDGYKVERQDNDIPDFSFNEVSGDNFALCYAGVVDEDKDHYLIYPPAGSDTSQRILVTNYDEDNYSIFRLPLSCMGTYLTSFTITWNDLRPFLTWNAMAAVYGDWNSFAYNSGAPFSIGGGQNGEIWRLAVTESEDNPVQIYNVTVIDATTVEVTTDYNNYGLRLDDTLSDDYIFLTAMTGMEELNNHQFPIVGDVISRNTFRLDISTLNINAIGLTPYVSGGQASRVIPFSTLFKKFNPYVNQDKKVRCGWLYMYVDSSSTDLRRSIIISNITQSNPAVVTTATAHELSTGDEVSFFNVQGMTEINLLTSRVTVLSDVTLSLDIIDSTAFGAYTQGGYVSTEEKAKINIDIITNDNVYPTQLDNLSQDPYQGSMTNMTLENGSKRWYKVFINQTGKFIQFRCRNTQAGSAVHIHATMPGFQPVGRLI